MEATPVPDSGTLVIGMRGPGPRVVLCVLKQLVPYSSNLYNLSLRCIKDRVIDLSAPH